jgi:hypothetical protein
MKIQQLFVKRRFVLWECHKTKVVGAEMGKAVRFVVSLVKFESLN